MIRFLKISCIFFIFTLGVPSLVAAEGLRFSCVALKDGVVVHTIAHGDVVVLLGRVVKKFEDHKIKYIKLDLLDRSIDVQCPEDFDFATNKDKRVIVNGVVENNGGSFVISKAKITSARVSELIGRKVWLYGHLTKSGQLVVSDSGVDGPFHIILLEGITERKGEITDKGYSVYVVGELTMDDKGYYVIKDPKIQ